MQILDDSACVRGQDMVQWVNQSPSKVSEVHFRQTHSSTISALVERCLGPGDFQRWFPPRAAKLGERESTRAPPFTVCELAQNHRKYGISQIRQATIDSDRQVRSKIKLLCECTEQHVGKIRTERIYIRTRCGIVPMICFISGFTTPAFVEMDVFYT